MTLERYFEIGRRVVLGAHLFEAGEIRAFARRYDPQPFHLDEALAARSVFGGLCASGWHTAAVWMKLNVATARAPDAPAWEGPGPEPRLGPSPGIRDLVWPKPVHVGRTVTYAREALSYRALASRPGWGVLTFLGEGHDDTGAKVLGFEGAVLVEVGLRDKA